MISAWSRRRFIVAGGLAVGPAGCITLDDRAPREVDVAIVGCGLSGLVAARTLKQAGVPRVVVLEARARVGGRTVNHDLGGGRIAEGGGQWVGPTQAAILDLCREMGVATFPTFLDGRVVSLVNKRRMETAYAAEAAAPSALFQRIDALAAEVPPEAPWRAPRAAQWDAISVADWARDEGLSQADRNALGRAASLTLGTNLEDLSFLYFLYYVRSAGSLHDLESMRGGAQDSRIEGGSQILSLRIAEEMPGSIVLSSPVSAISQDAQGVSIVSASGVYRSRRVVLALMPADCERIVFDPPLPAQRAGLQASWPRGGDSVKFNIVYDKPFWRARGLNGLGISDDPAVPLAVDNSPPDGSLGVLLVLTGGEGLPAETPARQAALLDVLRAMYGEEAAAPIAVHETNWGAETYTAHCVSGLRPSVLTQFGAALRAPVGRLHWAGTEASPIWTGYMDGAVRAGRQAALDAVAEL